MLLRKPAYKVVLFVIFCVLLNFVGKTVAEMWAWPVWLDTLGTVLAAYVLGPVCGGMVGVAVNVMYAWVDGPAYASYALVGCGVGILVGLCAKRGMLEHLFGTMTTGYLLTLLSVAISLPLNIWLFDGMTGNIWGDGVIQVMEMAGIRSPFGYMAGEFFVEFVDKVGVMLCLRWMIKAYRWLRGNGSSGPSGRRSVAGLLSGLFAGLMALAIVWVCALAFPALSLTARAQTTAGDTGATLPSARSGGGAAAYNAYVQTAYGSQNGLPGGRANDMAQTKEGVLWIATFGGLYRYNGSEFRLIDNLESVKSVNCLYTDEAGRLWIGTNDSGLSIMINEQLTNVISKKDGLPADSIRAITQDSLGQYYVGTSDSLCIVSLSGGLNVVESIDAIKFARSLSAGKDSYVAAVTDEGRLYLLKDGLVRDSQGWEGGEIYTTCVFGANGLLYAGTTENRVEVFQIRQGRLVRLREYVCGDLHNITSLIFSEGGVLFVCADNGAGYIEGFLGYQPLNLGQFSNSLGRILFDYQGNLWITSSRLGLLRLSPSPFRDITNEVGIEEKVVNCVTKWQGYLYIGTDKGLDLIKTNMVSVKVNGLQERLEDVRIRCLYVDSGNNLWISTGGKGLFFVSGEGHIQQIRGIDGLQGDKQRSVLELSDGSIAAAGDIGISFLEQGLVVGGIGAEAGLINPKVLCMLELEDGSLLAGTDGGGIALIKDKMIRRFYTKEDGLSSEVILRMVPESEGRGIFLITSNGLCFMEEGKPIRVLKEFPYYNNYDILENKGNLFVLSSAGIFVLDKEKLLADEKQGYELLDGQKGLQKNLTPNAWNYIDGTGRIYLSTDSGVMSMNLNQFEVPVKSYRMQLREIRIGGQSFPAEAGEDISLPSGQKTLELVPEVINYSVNNPTVSVWLEGVDPEPRIFQQKDLPPLHYDNLPAGTYTFRMAVLNVRGQVVAENHYRVLRSVAIYDYWWFRVYMVLTFAVAVAYLTWLLFRTQIEKTLHIKNRELELARRQVAMGNETIFTIAKAVDAKDGYTSQHSYRVAEYSLMIARRLGFGEDALEELQKTALLHDIGKIGVPDSVLNKPSRLTDEEYDIMKTHVVKGAEILKNFTLFPGVGEGALYHHERYDGKGYAHGLKGEDIPLNARIIGVADAFDAMTGNRVYRRRVDISYVLDELRQGACSQFDPKLVDVLLSLIDDGSLDVFKLYEEIELAFAMKAENE